MEIETEKVNYRLAMDRELERLKNAGETPTLLLHSCCGPCSSAVLETLSEAFRLTVFYYNPNIYPEEEYRKRLSEQDRLLREMWRGQVPRLEAPYDPCTFSAAAAGLEGAPAGGARCERCFRLRLKKTAEAAREHGFPYFTTTLSVSPHKNAQLLNRLGGEIGEAYGVKYLFSDFKKRDGYKRSLELSEQYGLYRQNYCGCEFSLRGKV